MSKITLKISLFLLFVFSFNQAQSQISASFYGNANNSKIGFGYDFNESLWTEVRLYSDTSIGNATAEAVLNYNFLRRETYDTYFGGGIVVNNLTGVILPIGARLKPFENLRNLAFHIELQPMYEVDFDDVLLFGFAGLRYTFN